MGLENYTTPPELQVDNFFKNKPASTWSISSFMEWKKSMNPFVKFSTCKRDFENNLEIIKKASVVPNDIKAAISEIKKGIKDKKAATPDTIISINYNNSTHKGDIFLNSTGNKRRLSHDKNSTPSSALDMPSHSNVASNVTSAAPSSPTPTSASPFGNPTPISSLYDHVYKLYKKQSTDISSLKVLPSTTYSNLIYNACVNLIKRFDDLNAVERSYLHVFLSSCLNTINAAYRVTLNTMIGTEKVDCILSNNSQYKPFKVYKNDVFTKLKDEIKEAYITNDIKGVKMYILREKQHVVENDLEISEAFTLKVLDIFDFVLNMINYRNWTSNTLTEEDFGFYWKYILEIIFRGSPIVLRRGESCCMSTKSERQVNEYEHGESTKSVYGRKIDLIFAAPIVNNALQEELIELGALEIKPASVSENVEVIQLNKNIRVNKSILHNIHSHVGSYSIDDLCVLGVDVVGLSAYIYRVKQFEDITIACKVSEENIFLPADEDDFEDFVFGDSLDQLFNYLNSIETMYIKVRKSSKKFKRLRVSSKSSGTAAPILQSPPRPECPFPSSNFFTPKRSQKRNAEFSN